MIWSILLLAIFASCSGSSNRWAVEHVHASSPEFASSRLTYHSKDTVNGVDLELMHIGKASYLYLTVHSHTVPAYNNNPKAAHVWLHLGDKKYEIVAFRHEGGQRLLLPDSIHSTVFDHLQAGKPLKVQLEGYVSTIDSKEFKEQFKAWKNPPIMENPLRLPF